MLGESQFKSFYESTKRELWGYIFRVCGDATLADDIFQDTYIKFLHADISQEHESAHRSYVFRIATNLIRNHWRRKKRMHTWEAKKIFDNDPATEHSTLTHDLEVAFQGLSPQQRSLLWLAYVEGFTHDEIAGMLKLRSGSVRVLLFRARKKLVKVLKNIGITSAGAS